MSENQKQAFVTGLRRLAESKRRLNASILNAIADYLERPSIPGDEIGLNWNYYIPVFVADAMDAIRTEAIYASVREDFKATGDAFPDIMSSRRGASGHAVALDLINVVLHVTGESAWLRSKLHEVFNAEVNVIHLAWRRFARRAYSGLIKRIKAESHRGNIGTFGSTTLMTYAMAGRVMFTFQRGEPGQRGYECITYVADDEDSYGHRCGPNYSHTHYATCVAMIDEVTALWDADKLVRDDAVGMEI